MEGLSIIQLKEIGAAFKQGAAAFEDNGFYKVWQSIYASSAYGSKNMDGAYEEMGVKTGLAVIPKSDDKNKAHPMLTAPAPRILRVRAASYRGAYAYLWEDLQDDKMGYYKDVAASLATALLYTRELVAHEPLNQCKNAAYLQGWDNLTASNTAIPLLNSSAGTYSNQFAAAAPSEATLEAILNWADRVPDHNGRPQKLQRVTILCHTTRVRAWRQVLKAPVAMTTDSVAGATAAAGTINSNSAIPSRFVADNVQVIGSPYLTASDLNSFVVLGPQSGLYHRKRFTKEGMYPENNPPKTVHFVWDKFALGIADKKQISFWGF